MNSTNRTRLRSAKAAHYLGISASTLAKWRMRGEGPPFHRCGPRIVFYFVDELNKWLEQPRPQFSTNAEAPDVERAPS